MKKLVTSVAATAVIATSGLIAKKKLAKRIAEKNGYTFNLKTNRYEKTFTGFMPGVAGSVDEFKVQQEIDEMVNKCNAVIYAVSFVAGICISVWCKKNK